MMPLWKMVKGLEASIFTTKTKVTSLAFLLKTEAEIDKENLADIRGKLEAAYLFYTKIFYVNKHILSNEKTSFLYRIITQFFEEAYSRAHKSILVAYVLEGPALRDKLYSAGTSLSFLVKIVRLSELLLLLVEEGDLPDGALRLRGYLKVLLEDGPLPDIEEVDELA